MAGFNAWQEMPLNEAPMGMPAGMGFQGGYGFGAPAASSYGPPAALAQAPMPQPDDAEVARWIASVKQPQQVPAQNAQPTPQAVAPEQLMGGKPPRGQKITGTTEAEEAVSVKASNMQGMMDELNNKGLDSLKQQGLSIASLKKQLGETQGRDMPVDLTGLAALTDAWTGSNFVGAYQPQETNKSRRGDIERLQGAIAQNSNALSGNEIDLLKNRLGMQMQTDKLAYDQGQDAATMDFNKLKHKDDKDYNYAKLVADKANKADPNALTGKDAFDMRIKLGNTSPATQARGVTKFLGAMNEYERAVDKYGIKPHGEGKRVLDSAYASMSTSFKEAADLGALAGPDLELLRQNVGNAADWGTWLSSSATGGVPGIKAAIAQARRGAENDFKLAHGNLKATTAGVESATGSVLNEYQTSFDRARKYNKTATTGGDKKPATVTQDVDGVLHTYTLNPKTGAYE